MSTYMLEVFAFSFTSDLHQYYVYEDCCLLLYLNMSTFTSSTGAASAVEPIELYLLGGRELRRQSLTLLLLS